MIIIKMDVVPYPLSDTHQPRIITSKAGRLHTRRLRLKRIQRPLGAQTRTHGAERAHRALLLHQRHSAPSTTTAAFVMSVAATATTTSAAADTDSKVDAEAHCLLNDMSRDGIICVFDARTEGAVWLWLGEEHGREETAHFCAGRRYGVARV
jgi:hypothetical protein